jgi:hypothetical protein
VNTSGTVSVAKARCFSAATNWISRPWLGYRRPDLVPPDISLSSFLKLDVKAVLLSYAHLDNCGNIGLLESSIPIVATPTLPQAMTARG